MPQTRLSSFEELGIGRSNRAWSRSEIGFKFWYEMSILSEATQILDLFSFKVRLHSAAASSKRLRFKSCASFISPVTVKSSRYA